MSCGELFVNLGGGGSYTPPNGMLQTAAALSSSQQYVKDNLGNNSALQISTIYTTIGAGSGQVRIGGSADALNINFIGNNSGFGLKSGGAVNVYASNTIVAFFDKASNGGIAFGEGTITQNGLLTIKGSGSNILSLRDSSNVEKGYVDNSGVFFTAQRFQFMPNGDYIAGSHNSGYTEMVSNQNCQIVSGGYNYRFLSTGVFSLGLSTSSYPALKRSSAILQTKLADDSAFAVHEVLSILTQKPTNSNAQKIKFGDKSPITDGALVVLGFDAQWEVEINGSSYWFAGKTSAFA